MVICWQPIHIFHCLISCLHQCFTNIDFSPQTSNERWFYSLRLSARLTSLSLHECKHEDFSIWGHISIIIWTTNTFFAIMNIALIFLVWFLHDRQCPLIGLNTAMNYITQFCWKHLAFGFTSYDLPEHYFIELHGVLIIFCNPYCWSLL